MTPAEHAALSAELARALGWPYIDTLEDTVCVSMKGSGWWGFDYRAPDVCLPLIEWLGMSKAPRRFWFYAPDNRWRFGGDMTGYDTLPEAVARSVIAMRTT